MKQPITIIIDKDVIKEMKITMANMEIKNQSQLIEGMIKEWVSKNNKTY
jgi:hypothetical protein